MSERRKTSSGTLTTLDALTAAGFLTPAHSTAEADALSVVGREYAIAVTPALTGLINRDDPADPIAAQFIPSAQEAARAPFEMDDPIGDEAHSPVAGIVHRYPDRVLLKAASTCPVYCRFCFRRERVGPSKGDALTKTQLSNAIDYIARTPDVWEVIVTGGDPLVLSPERIADIGRRLSAIPHVAVIRWHTRVPVAAPETLTDDRIAALAQPLAAAPTDDGAQIFVAVHTNHARELTDEVRKKCRGLARAGISLISQTVLLRGVNDTPDALAELFKTCVATGIKPYYLHQLDPAPGTSHFRVPLDEAQAIVRALRGHISGLCQPTFVVDIPGGSGKAVATPSDVVSSPRQPEEAGRITLRDRNGVAHRYDAGDG